MLSVTSPARNFGGCGWIRTTNLALMRRTLFPFELHSRFELEARGGIEPRAFPPGALRFGLEDRCRERGPSLEAMARFELAPSCLRNSALPVGATSPIRGRGVRPEPPLQLHGPAQSPFCQDESRPDNLLKNLVPEEGLKPSTSGL
jgi:hypothetical protein